MSDFQVGDRVSVEGVVRAVDACDGWFCVDPTGDDVRTYEVWHEDLTLIERPRRKLRVGSVWERRSSPSSGRMYDRYIWTGVTFVAPNSDHYPRETRDLDSNPELWREVPVEELEREAGTERRASAGCADCRSSTCQCDGTDAW